MRSRRQSESVTQQYFMQWLKLQYPRVHEVTASFPNEGKRSYKNASRMKAEGLKKGMPDLGIFYPTPRHHGMFIELKSPKGKLTEDQCNMMELLASKGYYCCASWTLESAQDEVRKYLNG
jgi:hypothetical protein